MHPSYLKVLSNDDYSLDALALNPTSTLSPMPDCDGYLSQSVLFGPDAAVEVSDDKRKLFMHGVVSDNPAFKQFVVQQEYAIAERVAELRQHPSDVVAFIGKWYHVDYDEEPLFRPYIIKVTRADGSVEISASKKDVFWSDEKNSYLTYDVIEPKDSAVQPFEVFRDVSERSIRRHVLQPFDSGFNSFGGILWHPTIEGHPLIYVPLEGAVSHRSKWRYMNGADLEPAYVEQFKRLDESLNDFKTCLLNGLRGDRLLASFVSLEDTIDAMADHCERTEARKYVTTLLGDCEMCRITGDFVEKANFPTEETIKFGQIPLQTTAKGFWMMQRHGPEIPERPPEYASFLSPSCSEDLDVVLTRCGPIEIGGYAAPCTYASDWLPYKYGEYRFLAFGPERVLSWQ